MLVPTFTRWVGSSHMRYLIGTILQLLGMAALAEPPQSFMDATGRGPLVDEPFITEYGMGVQRLPLDGGKIYGWEMNRNITFGRFKGESDEFGFSIRLNARERVEITPEGFRWRKAIGGSH